MDWSKLPDLAAVTLLASAFAAVARRSQAYVSALWLTGWMMIALHFVAFIFVPLRDDSEHVAGFLGIASLAWAGMLFMWASVPYRQNRSSHLDAGDSSGNEYVFTSVSSLCIPLRSGHSTRRPCCSASLPLGIALFNLHKGVSHPLRWLWLAVLGALRFSCWLFNRRPATG